MQIGAIAGSMALNGRLDAQRFVQGIKSVAKPGDRLDLDHITRGLEACKKAVESQTRQNMPPEALVGVPPEAVVGGMLSMYEQSWMTAFLAAAKGFLVLQYVEDNDEEETS